MSRLPTKTSLFTLAVLLVASTALANLASERTPRHWYDQHGNFVLLGNTLAQGCEKGTPAPLAGNPGPVCPSQNDTSPDYFWTLDATGEYAFADESVKPEDARTQAELFLPRGARVTFARVYWAATRSDSRDPRTPDTLKEPDTEARLTFRSSTPLKESALDLQSDVRIPVSHTTEDNQYQSSRDVTSFVSERGAGHYQMSGVDSIDLRARSGQYMFIAWWMVVFYELETEPMRHLVLFDGLDGVSKDVSLQLKGFYVPENNSGAKLGVVAFDGDSGGSDVGDWFMFNGVKMKNTYNPEDDFFNSSRSDQPLATGVGLPVAEPATRRGDLPYLSGMPKSMSGLDLDVVDVSLAPGKKAAEAVVSKGKGSDTFWLGGFVASLSTQRPDFRDTFKTVKNLSRDDGKTRRGDRLRYTLTTTNRGDDVSVGTVLTDVLPEQLSVVPDSILVNGQPMSDTLAFWKTPKTTPTLVVHLGWGATPSQGGEMKIGETATVSFLAQVKDDATGTIQNQAVVTAGGKLGAAEMATPSRPNREGTPAPTPTPIEPDGTDYLVAGRGCSSAGGAPLMWLATLLLGLGSRSRRPENRSPRRVSAAGGVALGLLSAVPATAQVLDSTELTQAIDVQRYKPGPGATDVLGLSGARVDRHLGWHLGTSLSYASNPLGFLDARENHFVYQVVATQVTAEVLGSLSLWDRFELGVALPVTYQASQRGADVTPAFAQGVTGTGLGDVRLVPKAHLLSSGALHLGLTMPVLLPTSGGQAFRGGSGVAVRPQVVGEWADARGLRVLANVGVHLRASEQLHNLRTGHELLFALGAQLPMGERLSAQAQLGGALGFTGHSAEELPLELLASVRYRLRDGLGVHVGGGPGLSRGYGTPGFRFVLGLDWTQPGERTAAPHAPPPVRAPDAAPGADTGGAEPRPERTARNPDPGTRKVRLESKRVALLEKVYFASGQDLILEQSFELLQQVAQVLKANAQVELLRVEGHTDDRDDDARNLSLSRRRADNVRAFLIREGVAGERLEAVGLGERHPVDTNQNEAGRENNRRVEFNIVRMAAGTAPKHNP